VREESGCLDRIGAETDSSGGKDRLGGISKQGHRYLRQMLVVGALAVIRYAQRHGTRRPWETVAFDSLPSWK
jgi:transposase